MKEDEKTLVSVIVPVYNVSKYLPKCIDSILAQKYNNIELILVDDGSTDNSYQICLSYATRDSRIKVFSQKNGGPSKARNKGLEESIGEFVTFVDSDDYIKPDYIIDMLAYKADIVVTGYINEYENSKKKFRPIEGDRLYTIEKHNNIDGIADIEFDYRWQGPAAKLYSRTLIEEYGLCFDDSFDYGEDHLFNMLFGMHVTKVAFLNRHNYIYMHRDSKSLTNRSVSSRLMFDYIYKLYDCRSKLAEFMTYNKYKYIEFANDELVKYFWQTNWTLIHNKDTLLKDKFVIIKKEFNNFPKDILFDEKYTLPLSYRVQRFIYHYFPLIIATYLLSITFLFNKNNYKYVTNKCF